MNVKNVLIYTILSIIMLFSVFANSNYAGYGNSKYLSGNCRNWLFSSCNPSVDDFSSLNVLSQTNSFNPIVYGNLNLNKYEVTQNYIYTFSGTSINIYDATDLSILTSNTIAETITSQPKLLIYSQENQTSNYLVFIGKIGNNYKLLTYGMDENSNIIQVSSVNISNKSVDMDISRFGSYVPIMLSNGTIDVYSLLGIKIKSYNTGVTNGYFLGVSQPPSNNNYLTVQDIDNDGVNEVSYAIQYQPTQQSIADKIGIIKLDDDLTEVLAPTTIALITTGDTNAPTYFEHNIEFVTHGSALSLPKIYLHSYFIKSSSGTDYYYSSDVIVSQTGTVLYQTPQTSWTQRTKYNSNMIFTDYDYNGIIEMCQNQYDSYTPMTRFYCFDSLFNKIENVTSFTTSRYISMGKIIDNNNTTKMSILTSNGIYNFYNSSDTIKVFNFTLNSDSYSIFLNLVNKINYTNDLIFINQNYIYTSISAGTEATCGDLVCSSLENNLNCPLDCNIENGNINQTVLKNPLLSCTSNNQCKSGSCVNNKCSFYSFGLSCTNNAQCISNNCESGKCAKETLEQGLTNYKNQITGGDDKSSTLFTLIITVIISLLLGVIVFAITKNGVAFVGTSLFSLIGCLVLFTFIQWLNPFILIGLIILILGGLMLYIFMRANNNG